MHNLWLAGPGSGEECEVCLKTYVGYVNVLSCRPGELRNKKAWEVGVAWQVKDIARLIAVAGQRGDSAIVG